MSQRSDEDLMVAAGRGDRQAFTALVGRHHRAVIHFVYRFLGDVDRATAEDLAQDVFLKAWKSAGGYRPRAKVLTWFLQITRNTSLNYRRSHRLRRRLPLDESDGHTDAAAESADAGLASGERARRVRAAITDLPHKQRAAIILRHYHELAYSDIAEILGVSVSAVESLLFRARESLRSILTPRENEGPSPQVSPTLCAKRLGEDMVL